MTRHASKCHGVNFDATIPALPTAMHDLKKRDEQTWTVSVDCKAADMKAALAPLGGGVCAARHLAEEI